jgi:hypothetical protein
MTADSNSSPAPESPSRLLKTVFLLVGTAAFGGLAIAFWNRKELAEMRSEKSRPSPEGTVRPAPSDDDTY